MASHADHPHAASWQPLQQAYRSSEATRRRTDVAVCDKRYVVNPVWFNRAPATTDPTAACPLHIEASVPPPLDGDAAAQEPTRAMAQGIKTRTAANLATWAATRARLAALTAESRRLRREKFQQVLLARATADTATPKSAPRGN